MKLVMFVILILIAAVGAGCSKKPAAENTAPPASTAEVAQGSPEGHAVGVVPGSYEDWCEEHGVAESMCTRCDPSLIPAFKAAGDWDEEHGLPKSQCLKCDPNLRIVRPPKPEGQ